MKTRNIIIAIVVAVAISLSFYAIYDSSTIVFVDCDPRYEQVDGKCVKKDTTLTTKSHPLMQKAQSLGIDNVMEAIDSEGFSYDEKKEYIKIRYEEDGPVTIPSLNLRIKDMPRQLEDGEKPTFRLIESGYANPCTSPKLQVYLIKGDRDLYSFNNDEPIFESQIVYSCPEFEKYYPVLNYWSEKDFPLFPACKYEGEHVIVGDSGTERGALDEYYCNGSQAFSPPEIHKIIIPQNASDETAKASTIPSKVNAKWGDILRFENHGDIQIRILGIHLEIRIQQL